MSVESRSLLCLLIREAGGRVYQWKRFKVIVYSLSQGSKEENKPEVPLFSYAFNDWCYVGMSDSELEEEMVILRDHGYITKERTKKFPDEKTSHEEIILLDRGKELADEAEANLSESQFIMLKERASVLINNEVRAEDLLHEYGHQWCQESFREMAQLTS